MTTVGVDLDGVLLNLETIWFHYIKRVYGKDAIPLDVVHWEMERWMGIPRPLNQLWKTTWGTPAYPFPDAIPFLEGLRKRGYEPHIVSNRAHEGAKDAGYRDVFDHFPPPLVGGVHFVEEPGDKVPILRRIGARAFVDDKWENAMEVGKALPYVRTYLLSKPYNRSLDLDVPYVRVSRLGNVLEDLDREPL